MVYRICGGIGLTLLGASMLGLVGIPTILTGIFLLVGGVALLAGV
jgi:hypothetical protein